MKMKNVKYGFVLAAMSLMVNSVYAQTSAVATPLPTNQVVAQPEQAKNDKLPIDYSAGQNSFEKEVTPLLREITRKKSILEIRKLDREIEKLDEDALKAQNDIAESSKKSDLASSDTVQLPNAKDISSYSQSQSGSYSNELDNTTVVMIYGSDNDLYAKVTNGSKGGFPVKKGDILPNGKYVYNVTPSYIEVGNKPLISNSKKKVSVQKTRIYATGYKEVDASVSSVNNAFALPQTQMPTTNIALPLPAAMPGNVTVPTTALPTAQK